MHNQRLRRSRAMRYGFDRHLRRPRDGLWSGDLSDSGASRGSGAWRGGGADFSEQHPHSPPHLDPKLVPEARQVDFGSMLVGWSEVVVLNHLLAFS